MENFYSLLFLFVADPIQIDNKTQSRIVLNQMLQQIFRIFDGLPVDPCTMCHVLQRFRKLLILNKKFFF